MKKSNKKIDLTSIRKKYPDKKIVFCSGSFDLIHAGHVSFLEDCKRIGDVLVVGIGPDKEIYRNKGPKRPILSEALRLKMVSSLRVVDLAFLCPPAPANRDPLDFLEKIFPKFLPDIYAINTDTHGIDYRKKICLKYKVKVNILKRQRRWCNPEFNRVSTSRIIEHIKKEC